MQVGVLLSISKIRHRPARPAPPIHDTRTGSRDGKPAVHRIFLHSPAHAFTVAVFHHDDRTSVKTAIIGFAAAVMLACSSARAEDAQGYWSGTIGNAINVFVQFNKSAEGQWEGILSVPQQNLTGKVDDLEVTPEKISFAVRRLRANYSARWNADEKAWVGAWSQGRLTPLNFARADAQALDALKPKRPQEDAIAARAPASGSSEVNIVNGAANVTLAATFTVPPGKGPFPAVVLVHGSGSINRDGESFGHRPFLVLADHLSRQGIAVLRYDKRGVGKSSGNLREATTLDLATDAEAAVRFLRGRAEVDAGHIGVIGHSEGGLIAPLLASRDAAIGFVVLLAAPGIRGDGLLLEQLDLQARARGVPESAIARDRALTQALFAAMTAEPKLDDAVRKAGLIFDEAERKGEIPAGTGKSMLQRFGTPWFHSLLSYEPAPALQATRQPILVLNGELDLQVPAAAVLPAIRTALKDNPRAVVKALPKLNHEFQTAKTGSRAEYGQIEETLAPLLLDTVSDWIRATVR
jgi:fermentation-respiration switch protein FrsA (DUF1100 family)